jgi:hypothetical protein
MDEELLRLEKQFGEASIRNDAEGISQFLSDDRVVINADGGIIAFSRTCLPSPRTEALPPHTFSCREE